MCGAAAGARQRMTNTLSRCRGPAFTNKHDARSNMIPFSDYTIQLILPVVLGAYVWYLTLHYTPVQSKQLIRLPPPCISRSTYLSWRGGGRGGVGGITRTEFVRQLILRSPATVCCSLFSVFSSPRRRSVACVVLTATRPRLYCH